MYSSISILTQVEEFFCLYVLSFLIRGSQILFIFMLDLLKKFQENKNESEENTNNDGQKELKKIHRNECFVKMEILMVKD